MWPTETPWPTVLMCSVPAVACASLAISHRSWKFLLGAVLCVTIALTAVVVDWLVESDSERVTARVTDMVRAFEHQDEQAMLDAFSPRALCERALAAFAVQNITVEQPLSLKDIRVQLQNENSVAIATFRVNGTLQFRGQTTGHQASQWQTVWRKEAGEWKIERLQELDPIRGDPINRLGSLGQKLCW